MWQIIIDHYYWKSRNTLINKLIFRGRFLGKRVRLYIRRLIKFFSNNYGKIVLFILAVYLFFALKLSLILYQFIVPYYSVTLVVVSVLLTYLFQLVPKRFKLRARLRQNGYAVEAKVYYGELKQFKYYVVRVSNPTNSTLLLDNLFLTNGLWAKGYDVIYINSGDEKPIDNENHSSTKPYRQAVIKPGDSMVIKFVTDMKFRYAYILDNYLKLHKVDIIVKDSRSEYRDYKRAMFTTTPEDEERVINAKWLKEEEPRK